MKNAFSFITGPFVLVSFPAAGKTTIVQRLAEMMGATLHVVNMSQQSDMSDLLGGFRPVDVRVLAAPLREKFEAVFTQACHKKARMGWLSTGGMPACMARPAWVG
jgi:midasin